jgi:hypothetical protein
MEGAPGLCALRLSQGAEKEIRIQEFPFVSSGQPSCVAAPGPVMAGRRLPPGAAVVVRVVDALGR